MSNALGEGPENNTSITQDPVEVCRHQAHELLRNIDKEDNLEEGQARDTELRMTFLK